jgi:hypothetical protein
MFILPLERKSPAPYADINSAQFLISAMSDDPPSRMIRVPTPLVDAVRELSRLHRQGRTKAVLEGIQKLITAIDSDTLSISIAFRYDIKSHTTPGQIGSTTN